MLGHPRHWHNRLLRSLSNRTGLGNFPAGLSTATACLGTFPHRFHIVVLLALGRAGVTDVGTDAAKLICKPRISRQQNDACIAYWRALVTKADAFRHRGRVMCEALINAG